MSAPQLAVKEIESSRHEPLRALTGVAMFSALGMVFAYARDAVLAAVFGASALTDAFFVATIIPTIAATVLVSGALAPAVLPVFRTRISERAQMWNLANTLVCWGGVTLALLTALIFFAAPTLVGWLAPGLDAATNALAIQLTQLGAPLVLLLGISALFGAFANALGSFRLPALATVLINGIAFLAILFFGKQIGITSAVFGMLLGAFILVGAQMFGLHRLGWRPRITFSAQRADLHETVRLFLPLVAFVALAQCVPIVQRMIGSMFQTGDLSLLAYANKLFQIPGVVVSSSLAVVLYPHLIQVYSNLEASAARTEWHRAVAQGIRANLFLTLPLALWCFWNALPLVQLIFQRGAFSMQDAQVTAQLLQVYMFAVVPAGIVLVLTRALHAQRKMRLTLGVGVLTFIVYVLAAIFSARTLGLVGLPFAFFISQVFAGIVLAILTFGRALVRGIFHRETVKLFVACGACFLLLIAFSQIHAAWMGIENRLLFAFALAASFGIMSGLYFALTNWLRIPEARFYLNQLRGRLRPSESQ